MLQQRGRVISQFQTKVWLSSCRYFFWFLTISFLQPALMVRMRRGIVLLSNCILMFFMTSMQYNYQSESFQVRTLRTTFKLSDFFKCDYNRMKKTSIYLCFNFGRSRLRRGPKIDAKLKNLAQTYQGKKQIKQYREEFETSHLSETFTQSIKHPKPRLKKRFKIDETKLTKVHPDL